MLGALGADGASSATGYLLTVKRGRPVSFLRKGKGGEKMKKRITLLIAAVVMALTMSFGSVAFAAIEEGNGNGNPNTTSSGKCPAGQNKDTSPGGLKKCG